MIDGGARQGSAGVVDVELAERPGMGAEKSASEVAVVAEYRSLVSSVLGLFVFYCVHDALQERAFRRPGFAFGWFMTAVEIGTMFACALVWEGGTAALRGAARDGGKDGGEDGGGARQRLTCIGLLVVAIAVSQGTGSAALQHVNYPVKVAFKSSKLVPTMVVSQCVNAADYGPFEYVAALLMCASLALLGLADARAGAARRTQVLGYVLLTLAVCSDAVIPNLQQKLLRGLKVPTGEMVVISNLGSFVLVLGYVAFTGELAAALAYCATHPHVVALLAAQALAGYAGLRCYLAVIRRRSGVVGVLAASARKVVTLVLSFLLFEKPFNGHHAAAFLLLALGIALTIVAKQRHGRR